MKKKLSLYAVLIGFINALFGAGGGMIAVPLLKSLGLEQKSAQATAICVILPLTVVTSVIYILKGYVTVNDALPFIIPGFVGAVFGTMILKKATNRALRAVFALFMLWSGIKMIMR